MGETSNGSAEERVWRGFPPQARHDLEHGLARTDLTTLLMSVTRSRARQVKPAALLRRWTEDRFVRPSAVDPRRLSLVEARLWQLLPDQFVGVELSPVAPLGTVSALGRAPVDQHRVVSTIRGTEADGVLRERLHDTVLSALAREPTAVPVVEDPARTKSAGYYAGLAIGVRAERNGQEVDLGDGGLTDYTAELLSDAKERCFVSCVSTERLTALG